MKILLWFCHLFLLIIYVSCDTGHSVKSKERENLTECVWSACTKNASNLSCPGTDFNKELSVVCENNEVSVGCCKSQNKKNKQRLDKKGPISDPYVDVVRRLLFEGNDSSGKFNFLHCREIDPNGERTLRLNENTTMPVCDFCAKFPHRKVNGGFLNKQPTATFKGIQFGECFRHCYADKSCMIYSYNMAKAICYTYNSTVGEMTTDKTWKSVIMNQPTGMLKEWIYSRNTQFVGNYKKLFRGESFLHCISECDNTYNCNVVSHRFIDNQCFLFSGSDDILQVNYVFGHTAAVRKGMLVNKEVAAEHFVLKGPPISLSKTAPVATSSCQRLKNATHGAYHVDKCQSHFEGCDTITGCQACYYPETLKKASALPMCPDSVDARKAAIRSMVNLKMNECVRTESCIGVGYTSKNEKVSTMSMHDYASVHYDSVYMLDVPPDPARQYLTDFIIVPKADIQPIFGKLDILTDVNIKECLSAFSKKKEATRLAYSFTKLICKIGGDDTAFIRNTSELSVVFVKKPSLLSLALNYVQSPGYKIMGGKPREQNRCKKDCTHECSILCSLKYRTWCSYFTIKLLKDGYRCSFYGPEKNLKYGEDPKVMTFRKTSIQNFTLESLNLLPAFQSADLLRCMDDLHNPYFRKNKLSDFLSGVADIVQWTESLVTVPIKSISNLVANTISNGGQALEKVFTGDNEGAAQSALQIPIIDFSLNIYDFGEAVFTGQFEKIPNLGHEILSSDIVQVGLSLTPPAINIVKETAEFAHAVSVSILNGSVNKPLKNQKRLQISPSTLHCTKPVIEGLLISDSFTVDCFYGKQGVQCHYECEPGYVEEYWVSRCDKRGGVPKWLPEIKCNIKKCPDGNYPIIILETPQTGTGIVPSFGEQLTAYVILFNKLRKLPVWSVALHDADHGVISPRRNGNHFRTYPCAELQRHQTTNKDYAGTPWHKSQLTPANVMEWSHKARELSYLYLNTAPQDAFTHWGPWAFLESHIHCFSKTHRIVVATGICDASLVGQSTTMEIPTCFWKMVCYVDEVGNHQVVGFYAGNSLTKTDEEKFNRTTETLTPLSQQELSIKIEGGFRDVWSKSMKYLSAGRRLPYDWLPTNILKCETALDLSEEEKNAWKSAFSKTSHHMGLGKKFMNYNQQRSALKRGCDSSRIKTSLMHMSFNEPYRNVVDSVGLREKLSFKRNETIEEKKCKRRIIGYYSSSPDSGNITNYGMNKMEFAVYSYLKLNRNGTVALAYHNEPYSERLRDFMAKANNYPLKKLFAVGESTDSKTWRIIASQMEARVVFLASVLKVINHWKFDGIEIHWTYPMLEDKNNFVSLLKDLRMILTNHARGMDRKREYFISIAVPLDLNVTQQGFDIPRLINFVDFMTIKSKPDDCPNGICKLIGNAKMTAVAAINDWYMVHTKKSRKMNIMISHYENDWDFAPSHSFRLNHHRDVIQSGISSADGHQISLQAKIDFIGNANVDGLGIWTVEEDDANHTLLRTIYNSSAFCNDTCLRLTRSLLEGV